MKHGLRMKNLYERLAAVSQALDPGTREEFVELLRDLVSANRHWDQETWDLIESFVRRQGVTNVVQ